jgi:hypothetical protein
MLSKTKYAARCVLGMEIFFVLCVGYGLLLLDSRKDLHHALFELIPGFIWGNPVAMVWGAVFAGVWAWIVGWYIAWMHNASIIVSAK